MEAHMLRRNAVAIGAILCCVAVLGCQPQATIDVKPPALPEKVVMQPPPIDGSSVAEASPPATRPTITPEPTKPITGASEPLPKESYVAAGARQSRVHVVQPKETLQDLARRYYSDGTKWRRIYEANRQRIADPDKIRAGMKLIIP
jgi:nucleoid-associated protein YgaU